MRSSIFMGDSTGVRFLLVSDESEAGCSRSWLSCTSSALSLIQ